MVIVCGFPVWNCAKVLLSQARSIAFARSKARQLPFPRTRVFWGHSSGDSFLPERFFLARRVFVPRLKGDRLRSSCLELRKGVVSLRRKERLPAGTEAIKKTLSGKRQHLFAGIQGRQKPFFCGQEASPFAGIQARKNPFPGKENHCYKDNALSHGCCYPNCNAQNM